MAPLTAEQNATEDHAHIAREALRRSRFLRLTVNAALAVMMSTWIGWWSFVWLLADAMLKQVIDPFVMRQIHKAPFTQMQKHYCRVAMRAFGAAVQCLPWVASWAIAGAPAGFFAGVLLMGAVIHGLVYFSASRDYMFATVAPPVFMSLGALLIFQPTHILSWVVLPVMVVAMLRAYWARTDQVDLFEAVSRNRAMRKAAEESNIAKSQFLATMSHELRTPLNAVIGYAEILEEDLGAEGKKEAAGDAGRIRRAARDLLNLINEVLDLSKIEAGRMDVSIDKANVPEIVNDVIETTAHIAKANGDTVNLRIDPRIGELMIDGVKFRQCLLNLMSNACKFTSNGVIDVEIGLDDHDDAPILHATVIDTGIGIAPDQAGRLFQPFVQADGSKTRAHGGTGLGLVITRRLAQLMGGDVTMQSVLGQGSKFVLTLAAAWPDTSSAERGHSADAPLVLVIEDETAARDLVRRALARMPLNVLCASTASEGARLAMRQAPALIVLDIHLPDGSGWDLLAEFKADPALMDVPVLVVSVDDDRGRALGLGACEHLVKPVDRDRLAAAVLRYLRLPATAQAA